MFAFYQATKAICQKFLKVRGTKTCSYLRTYKESKARNQIRKRYNICFIHLYILNKKLYYLYNIAEVLDGQLKSKFKSPNDIHLSTRILSKAEIFLLSKGLKFIPTPTSVNKALIREELECFDKKLRLLWHFRNEESITISNSFKKKSTFNPRSKDAAIELYLSRLEEEIVAIDTKLSYSNRTKEERVAFNSLRDDNSTIIKEADE